MRRSQGLVAIELAPRQADEVGCIQPGVLRVDCHEHLNHVVFGQAIENDRRYAEVLAVKAVDICVEGEEPMLAVDSAEDPLPLRDSQDADAGIIPRRLKGELFVATDDDGAGNGWKIVRLPALLVILHQLVDFSANDLTLVGLLVGRDTALEQIPVDL